MNINIKGTNIELTEAITNYIYDKLESVKKVLTDVEGTYVHVEVGRISRHHAKGDVFKAEFEVKSQGVSHYAHINTEDLYSAIDMVKDEIVEKIKSHKSKNRSHFLKGAQKAKKLLRDVLHK